jgi:ABC-type cobalamin/Fe3+-siderophores transport system ATPase subunit
VLGQDPASATEDWRARTGVVLQSWRDHPRWTARRLLAQLGEYYRPYSTADRPRPHDVDDLLETVGLSDLADQKINTLSGGQRRRLDVAIGIVGRPELLFLDEPTAGFDPQARREFHDLIRQLSRVERTTILPTTHDLDEAERLASRVLVLAGIFYPIQRLWDWVEVVVQVFPLYWLGLGMRSAFLPDSAAALEVGGSWRTWQTVAVLGAWAVAGALVTPPLLFRMARRQSGSAVEAGRQAAVQWVK